VYYYSAQGDTGSSEIQVDKHRLVAKIVQLQTLNASLTNKVEFLQGHVDQLMIELRNKSRSDSLSLRTLVLRTWRCA